MHIKHGKRFFCYITHIIPVSYTHLGVRQGFLEDVTAQNSTQTTKLSLSYMSTHPQKYRRLADSPENRAMLAELFQMEQYVTMALSYARLGNCLLYTSRCV